MNASLIVSLRSQRGGPRDGALLRFSLGNALIAAGDGAAAIDELRRALVFDPVYSAAWKLLGKALLDSGQIADAMDAWRRGIAAAAQRGDKQAEKEMTVFLRRLEKTAP
ncbi:BTAD domain-containing putative transcriptional regulator [Rhodanobacter sp. L36]|uniref:BTAD domain-containing putative transcriptional regulator n=1 Tax=Rhodanobacter sp. L36 TaxID=1747221 RepID=UPI00131BE521|nr:BTAD domain-containing putative transcriptional regulator [Rhodanobacter sp. L36]